MTISPAQWPENTSVKLSISGAEAALPDFAREFQKTLRDFAIKVMRPIGRQLDKLSPEAVIAEGSPYWDFLSQFAGLGITPELLYSFNREERGLISAIVYEEITYGDAGLATTVGAGNLPHMMIHLMGSDFLKQRFSSDMLGCWGITEPDHGSNMLDAAGAITHPFGSYGRPNCIAKLRGNELVINGQKSAWVSNGVTAQICMLYCAADTGNGPDPSRGYVVVVPLDSAGVSRGKPLDKMGQRALNQGEVFFDNVTLSTEYILAHPEDYQRALYCVLAEANAGMGSMFSGLAHAAYDLSYEYVHERKQGGVAIIHHQSVASRLFHLYRKVEASRALSRRVFLYNSTADIPALQSSIASKITGTSTAFEVASEALQLFGGNGMTREYPIEKIFRDARASMIEDGCNDMLAIKAGRLLSNCDRPR